MLNAVSNSLLFFVFLFFFVSPLFPPKNRSLAVCMCQCKRTNVSCKSLSTWQHFTNVKRWIQLFLSPSSFPPLKSDIGSVLLSLQRYEPLLQVTVNTTALYQCATLNSTPFFFFFFFFFFFPPPPPQIVHQAVFHCFNFISPLFCQFRVNWERVLFFNTQIVPAYVCVLLTVLVSLLSFLSFFSFFFLFYFIIFFLNWLHIVHIIAA